MARTSQQAKELIESLRPLQENGDVFPCPRCGHDRMSKELARNALSRRADVYICSACGTEEAILDVRGEEPLPFTEWAMVLGFDSESEKEDDLFDEQRCRVCGCTEDNACEGGCYWVEYDLCSKCVEKMRGGKAHETNTF